jgi:PAS domain S-box-containing protein
VSEAAGHADGPARATLGHFPGELIPGQLIPEGWGSGGAFRELFEQARVAMSIIDVATWSLVVNPTFLRLYRFDVPDPPPMEANALTHPDDLDRVNAGYLRLAAREVDALELQIRSYRADGTEFDAQISGNLLIGADDETWGILTVTRDVSARVEAERQLASSESRFRRMIENIDDTVSLVAADGRVISTTGDLRPVMGYPEEFWSMRNVFELAHPHDLSLLEELRVELLARPGAEVITEFRARNAQGDWIDVEAKAVNLLEDPDVGAIVLTTRNIEARKQAERQLAEARDRALRELELRNELVASVSHELRTPIHGLLGLTELLGDTDLDPTAKELVGAVTRATEALRHVLDDILDHARIESGRMELLPGPVDVEALLADVVALFDRPSGPLLQLEVDADGLVPVRTDGGRLRQVVTNLVSNAVKFTHEGEIVVRLRSRPTGEGRLRVLVEVVDTGIGIPADRMDELFEPFSQAHATTATTYGGTGLGLSISRRLVQLLGGQLQLSSIEGGGTRAWFELQLPAAVDADERDGTERGPQTTADSEAVGSRPPDDATTNTSVLVVEDNAVNRLVIEHQLRRLGLSTSSVADARDAIEAFAADPPALVLMDVQLPGTAGPEAAEALRRIERDQGRGPVPILAITADALPEARRRCLDAGMDDVLLKPLGLHQLGEALGRHLDRPVTVGGERSAMPAMALAPEVLGQLSADLGDRAPVVRVVRAYLHELVPRVEQIGEALARGDRTTISSVAHTLGSTSATVGALSLAAACHELETFDPAVAGDVLAERVEAVEALVPAVESGLEAWLGQAERPSMR